MVKQQDFNPSVETCLHWGFSKPPLLLDKMAAVAKQSLNSADHIGGVIVLPSS